MQLPQLRELLRDEVLSDFPWRASTSTQSRRRSLGAPTRVDLTAKGSDAAVVVHLCQTPCCCCKDDNDEKTANLVEYQLRSTVPPRPSARERDRKISSPGRSQGLKRPACEPERKRRLDRCPTDLLSVSAGISEYGSPWETALGFRCTPSPHALEAAREKRPVSEHTPGRGRQHMLKKPNMLDKTRSNKAHATYNT